MILRKVSKISSVRNMVRMTSLELDFEIKPVHAFLISPFP